MGYLEQHLKKYPLMQIEDKIKLIMQSILGPSHLINDKDFHQIHATFQASWGK